jgi:hypothetical protein
MKGKSFIAEIEEGFYHSTTQYLVGTHPICTGSLRLNLTFIQVLQNMLTNGSVLINDLADHLQLLTLGVVHDVRHETHLFLPLFAHFVAGSFSAFVVILVGWCLPKYYKKYKNASTKCAFFISFK